MKISVWLPALALVLLLAARCKTVVPEKVAPKPDVEFAPMGLGETSGNAADRKTSTDDAQAANAGAGSPPDGQNRAAAADTAQGESGKQGQDGTNPVTDPCAPLGPGAPPPPPLNSDPKKQVRNLHMTWQHDTATTLTVTWTTEATDLKAYVPHVLYAPATQTCDDGRYLPQIGQVATGSGSKYIAVLGDAEVPMVAWTVELKGLQPETAYTLRAGTWAEFVPPKPSQPVPPQGQTASPFKAPELSKVGSFRTAPLKGVRHPMPFVVAGDSRGGAAQILAGSPLYSKLPAITWFFSGDMNTLGVQSEFNEWFEAMAETLRQHPLMPVQGNHELFADVFYNQFALPVMPGLPSDYAEHAWSLNFGNLHFVGLDSNSDIACKDQSAWLQNDLKAAQADKDIDFTVVEFHHGTYSSSNHGSTDYVQAIWVPLFEKYGVDLVLNGHDHNYERTVPILAGSKTTADKGIVYVVAGGFFAPPYDNGNSWFTHISHHGNKYNYLQMLVDGHKLKLTAWSGDGKEKLDEFEVVR